jgi:uncharacterized membrane protein
MVGGFMKPEIILGIILVVLASLAFTYQDFSHTMWEKTVKAGMVEAPRAASPRLPLDPVVSQLVLAGGIVLVIIGIRESFHQPRRKQKLHKR